MLDWSVTGLKRLMSSGTVGIVPCPPVMVNVTYTKVLPNTGLEETETSTEINTL